MCSNRPTDDSSYSQEDVLEKVSVIETFFLILFPSQRGLGRGNPSVYSGSESPHPRFRNSLKPLSPGSFPSGGSREGQRDPRLWRCLRNMPLLRPCLGFGHLPMPTRPQAQTLGSLPWQATSRSSTLTFFMRGWLMCTQLLTKIYGRPCMKPDRFYFIGDEKGGPSQ